MLNQTANFENHYDIKEHFWIKQGELKFQVYDVQIGVTIVCSTEYLKLHSPHNPETYVQKQR